MRVAGAGGGAREESRQPQRRRLLGAGLQGHRPRAVEDEIEVRSDLLAEELQRQLIAASVGVPVNVAQVVSGLILAVVAELQRTARAPAQRRARSPRGAWRQTQTVAQPRL